MNPATALALHTWPLPDYANGRFNAHLLSVTFAGPEGESRTAVGGGESVEEAVEAARHELPPGGGWTVARWSPLFGE